MSISTFLLGVGPAAAVVLALVGVVIGVYAIVSRAIKMHRYG
ncbi:MAG: hypothetical protein Kow006_18320 [Gammaproteobacteria bacterium]